MRPVSIRYCSCVCSRSAFTLILSSISPPLRLQDDFNRGMESPEVQQAAAEAAAGAEGAGVYSPAGVGLGAASPTLLGASSTYRWVCVWVWVCGCGCVGVWVWVWVCVCVWRGVVWCGVVWCGVATAPRCVSLSLLRLTSYSPATPPTHPRHPHPTPPVLRPSAVPKGKSAVPVATDGKLGPSSPEAKAALLLRLHMSERSLEVRAGCGVRGGGAGSMVGCGCGGEDGRQLEWDVSKVGGGRSACLKRHTMAPPPVPSLLQRGTEKLREWLAARVLQPLVRAIDGAAADVMAAAQRCGLPCAALQPLDPGPPLSAAAAAAAAAGRARSPAQQQQQYQQQYQLQQQQQQYQGDDELAVATLRAQLVHACGGRLPPPEAVEARACLVVRALRVALGGRWLVGGGRCVEVCVERLDLGTGLVSPSLWCCSIPCIDGLSALPFPAPPCISLPCPAPSCRPSTRTSGCRRCCEASTRRRRGCCRRGRPRATWRSACGSWQVGRGRGRGQGRGG